MEKRDSASLKELKEDFEGVMNERKIAKARKEDTHERARSTSISPGRG